MNFLRPLPETLTGSIEKNLVSDINRQPHDTNSIGPGTRVETMDLVHTIHERVSTLPPPQFPP